MKLFIFILFLGIAGISQAQKAKIKIDGDVVLVNGEPSFILESPVLSSSYKVYNMQNELLAVFNEISSFRQIKTSTGAQTTQHFSYLAVTFSNEEQSKCETGTYPVKKLLAMMIVKNGLVENGQLNNDNVLRFCEERGFYYSSRR
jgi:hypothetical protein